MHFVAIKTPEQMDLLALHRVRSRLVGQRTGVINQIRGFLIERGITVRQGVVPLRKALPDILSSNTDALSPRMVNLIAELVQDWRRLDERIAAVSAEIEALAQQDEGCQRVMTVPGVGPIISSAVVAAIGNGAGFTQGRDSFFDRYGDWIYSSAEVRWHDHGASRRSEDARPCTEGRRRSTRPRSRGFVIAA